MALQNKRDRVGNVQKRPASYRYHSPCFVDVGTMEQEVEAWIVSTLPRNDLSFFDELRLMAKAKGT